jgi:hypothetical protein
MITTIFQTLEKLGLLSKQSRVLFNDKTRDVDDFYIGNETYVDGSYGDYVRKAQRLS